MAFLYRDGIRLYYEVHGGGEPLLFLSETACHCDVWKLHQLKHFSQTNTVILYDYRGTGRSDWTSSEYTIGMFAADAAAILEHVGAGPAIVCGHSMGASVAQVMALDHPDKVNRLILASGRSHYPRTKGIPLRIAKEMVEWGYERYLREHSVAVGFNEDFVRAHPDRVEAYLRVRMAHLNPVEFYLRHVIARQKHDVKDRLRNLALPTLVLVGNEEHHVTSDSSLREAAVFLAREIPNARFHTLPGEKHSYFFVNPAAAHEAIREFLC